MTPSTRLKFILTNADVPEPHKLQIRRKVYDKFEQFIQMVLNQDKENFFVLLEGAPGTGKTNLLCNLLWNRSDICGHYFKKIAWLRDGNLDPNNAGILGLHALVLLTDGSPISSIGSPEHSTAYLLNQLDSMKRPQIIRTVLSKFLAENPRTLLIIDEVYLRETVDLFATLKCSIIATSTRPEVFSHIDRCQSFHLSSDDVYEEDVKSLCLSNGIDSIGENSAREIIRLTGGNFALMEKLLKSADADTRKLQTLLDQLQFGQLDIVKCVSHYQHESLNTCYNKITKLLDTRFVSDLPTLAVLQPSTWIDIEIVSLVWPVDVPGSGQSNITHFVSKDMNTLSRNSLVERRVEKKSTENIDQTRIDPLLQYYLLSKSDHQILVNTLAFFKRDLQQEKSANNEVERLFKKYWIDNENNLQQLDAILKQPKRRTGTTPNNKSSASWFSNWITYFWPN